VEELRRDSASVTVRTTWPLDPLDLGILRFETGDIFVETYYADRWYNIFQVHGPDGRLKGWYCNIARPAVISADTIDSEDLELDLIVAPDRRVVRLDDEEEYAARGLMHSEPEAHAAAIGAVEELRALIAAGAGPFAFSSHPTPSAPPR
jgi:protein associated with RNAse G/E